MRSQELFYSILLLFTLTALLGMGYGWQNVAYGATWAVCGLLLGAIKRENSGPYV